MIKNPHIEAEIQYITTEEGGRSTAVKSGYRGQFHYKGENNEGWDAAQEFIGKEWVEPGETVSVKMIFASPEKHCRRLFEGMPFQIQEGGRIVGLGIVKNVFPSLSLNGESSDKAI